jgi:hypothetical protein
MLRPGDTWIYTFPSVAAFPIVETRPFTFGPAQQTFSFAIDPASFQTGSQLRYEIVGGGLYEDACCCFDVGPLASAVLTSSPPSSASLSYSGVAWLDIFYPGGIRFTMISGSLIITNITLEARIPHPGPSGSRSDSHHLLSFSPVPAPLLQITGLDTFQARVSWPSSATAYILEFAINLPASPCGWQRATNSPVVLGNHNALDFDSSKGARFFRLRRR